jgi:phosphoglycerol transferase MdoB-like AlkP superfamily enzyme
LEEAEQYYSPIINKIEPYKSHRYPVKNVVIIILEGFSQYLIKGMEPNPDSYQGYCPFLDSLLHQSISFNGIANGHRTIDALQAIFTGLPKLLDKSVNETYFANNLTSSPVEVLKKHNFNTLFFHGAKNGSMNIESYCYSIGFEAYYGKNEYPNPSDYDGAWGISDRSFLKFVAQKLNTAQQPFFASILTLSSHHPFVIPKDAEGLDLKTGKRPIHTLASYTDHAIREFFEEISKYAWYDNTLFIITGDHVGEGSLPRPSSIYATFQIPIFFYHPKAKSFKDMGTMQQLDIMPGLFSYLNIDEPLFSYGNNIFDTTYTSYSANYLWGVYQLISDDYILQFDGEESIGLYDIKEDILMRKNLLTELPEVAELYEQKLKAILQSYTTRLHKNQLFINKN